MATSPAFEAAVHDWVDRLEQLAAIDRCEVVVEVPHRHRRRGKLFHVQVRLAVRNRRFVITRNHTGEDAFVALAEAFRAVRRGMQDDAAIRRGDVKLHV